MPTLNFDPRPPHTTHYGIGRPSDDLGRNGDYYRDEKTGTLYGPKEGGRWPNGSSLLEGGSSSSGSTGTGTPGSPGAPGVGVPAGGEADWYLVKKSANDFDTEWRPFGSANNDDAYPFDFDGPFDAPEIPFDGPGGNTTPGAITDHGALTGLDDPTDHPWAATTAQLAAVQLNAAVYANQQDAATLLAAATYTNEQIAALEVGADWDATTVTLDFSTDEGLTGPYVVTQPDGVSANVPSIVSGRQRFTAGESNDGNLREIYSIPGTGALADSEVRATWPATSIDLASTSLWQPGNAHRLIYDRIDATDGTVSAGGGSTLTDSSQSWTTNEWIGEYRYYVTITAGAGSGQTRHIVSNTATQLTLNAAWTTNPNGTSTYEVWRWRTRALVWAPNVVFGAHGIFNFYTWEDFTFTLVGGFNAQAYLGSAGGPFASFPWNIKSRVVGNVTECAVWIEGDPEPDYDTPGQSGRVTIPDGWGKPGECGIYVAHIPANGWLEVDDVTVTGRPAAPDEHNLQIVNWDDTPGSEGLHIDASLGDYVLAIVGQPGGQVFPPTNPRLGQFLTVQLVQGPLPFGVLFNQVFQDAPIPDTNANTVTTATWRYNGAIWTRVGGGGGEEAAASGPPIRVTRLQGFGDGRSGQNTAASSQDSLTLGAAIGSDKQYCIYFRTGDPTVPSNDGYACISSRDLPNGAWSEAILQDSDEFTSEIGIVYIDPDPDDLFTSYKPFDSHRTLSIAHSIDGFCHVAGNTHSDPIHYVRSTTVEGDPDHLTSWVAPGMITPYTGGERPTIPQLAANEEDRTTYWSFVRSPVDGTLLVFYREGLSGGSDGYVCNRYVPSGTPGVPGTWQRRGGTLFLRTSSSFGNNHSWYPMRFVPHPTEDKIAMFGTFRYGYVPNNQGFYFAWLDGFFSGATPSASRADGTVITANTATTPLTNSNIEEVFPTAPYMQNNGGGADIDSLGRPHTYSLVPDGTPFGTAPYSLQLAHVWWDGSDWQIDIATNVPSGFTSFNTGGGRNIWNRAPVFCVGSRTYIVWAPATGGKQDSLRVLDVTDPDDIFEFTIEEGLRVYQGQLDSRALAERNELHMFRLPTDGALYPDNVQFQVVYTLSVDLEQMNKVSTGTLFPRLTSIRNEHLGLVHLGDDFINHEGYGVRLAGTTWRSITGAVPITPDLLGKLLFVRLHVRMRSANVFYGGRARVRYVIGGEDSQTATILFPTGTTEPQMRSTQWIPIPETSVHDLYDGTDGTGYIQVVARCEATGGVCWVDLATVELGVFENATGHWPEGQV